MALSAYLTLTGTKQGPIRGSVTQKSREGSIEVIGVFHGIISPRDPASGRPTGKRMHKPLIVTKAVDKSSPLLENVLTQNENLKTVEIRFFRPSSIGAEKHAFTIGLSNANISSIQLQMRDTRKQPRMPELEEVAFTYQEIDWTWVEGGITASDDWEIARQ